MAFGSLSGTKTSTVSAVPSPSMSSWIWPDLPGSFACLGAFSPPRSFQAVPPVEGEKLGLAFDAAARASVMAPFALLASLWKSSSARFTLLSVSHAIRSIPTEPAAANSFHIEFRFIPSPFRAAVDWRNRCLSG